MTDAERRAAEVASNHRPSSRLIDGRRVGVCSCRQWTGDLATGHGAHVAAMLAQAGVLADAQHDAGTDVAAKLAAWLDRDDVSENRAADEVHARAGEVAALFAQHDAEVAAKVLRGMAARFREDAAAAWGGSAGWLTTGQNVAALAADWCDDEAERTGQA